MASLSSINIRFSADLKDFSTKMQSATRSIKKMGKQLTKVGKGLSVSVTAPIVALGALSVLAWDKQEKAIAQVEAGLKSTGAAVGYTSEQLQKMAADLQATSLFGDEEILQGATAQLLTFTNIAGEQFKRTQLAAIDLATRLGGDLKSASIQLGKALNDPVANLSALSRSGIQFSSDQKQMINSLVKTNRLADAQTLILNELEKQYGGAGAAAAKAGAGPFKQLANSIGDLSEDFGEIIGKALLPFVEKIKGIVVAFKSLDASTKKTIVIVGSLAAAVGPLLVVLGFLMTTVIPGLITAFGFFKATVIASSAAFKLFTATLIANPLTAIAVGLAAVISYFVFFKKETEEVVKSQSLLSQITDKAAKSIAGEKAKIVELLAVAKHEGVSKAHRIKAIQELNAISPEFLGNLTLESINTDTTRIAVEKYNTELLKTARIKAAQAKLQEIAAKQIDAELNLAKVQKALAIEFAQQWADKAAGVVRLGNVEEAVLKTTLENSKQVLTVLGEEEQAVLDIITAYALKGKAIVKATPTPTVKKRKKATTANAGLKMPGIAGIDGAARANKIWQQQLDMITELRNSYATNTVEYAYYTDLMNGITAQMNPTNPEIDMEALGRWREGLNGIKDNLSAFSKDISATLTGAAYNVAVGFGEIIGGMLTGNAGIGDLTNLLLGTFGSMLIQLGKIAIKVGLGIKAIKKAFQSLNPFVAIAAGVALVAFGTIIKNSISNIGKDAGGFASGGIVGGSSYVGDQLFARVNSGEMILNQGQQNNLSGMLQSSAQAIKITLGGAFELDGRKLRLILDNTNAKILRTT